MSDLISRQAAIDVLNKLARENFTLINAFSFYLGALHDAADEIKNLPSAQPEQRWIPVTERLPDEYGEYLVTKRTIGWNCEEYNSIDIAYFDNDGFHKAYKALAWMPLPEPYAERREDA